MSVLKRLQQKHREIGRLSFQGFHAKEIAERTGMSLDRTYAILRDPLCKAYMESLNDAADTQVLTTRERLIQLESSAMDRAEELLAPEANVPAASLVTLIKDVLDRNGYKAPDKSEVVHKFDNESEEELDARIEAAKEALKELSGANLVDEAADETPADPDQISTEEPLV